MISWLITWVAGSVVLVAVVAWMTDRARTRTGTKLRNRASLADKVAWGDHLMSLRILVAGQATGSGVMGADPGHSLSLLTWNVQLLSLSAGYPDELIARTRRIAEAAAATNANVICFQEVFDPAARAALVGRLVALNYDVDAPPPIAKPSWFAVKDKNGSGLVTAVSRSTAVIETRTFKLYPAQGPEAFVFEKGASAVVFGAAIAGQSVRVAVINSHLQSDYFGKRNGQAIRRTQWPVLAGLVREVKSSELVVIAGDLNCAAGSVEAVDMLEELGKPVDPLAQREAPTFPAAHWRGGFFGAGRYVPATPRSRLDYILQMATPPSRLQISRVDPAPYLLEDGTVGGFGRLSDHVPLIGWMRFCAVDAVED